MAELISVCGLIVIPQREQQGWECGLYHEELTEVDLSVALNFTRKRIHDDGLGNGYDRASFIAAAFHPGHVDQCPGIEYADQPVNAKEEYENHSGIRRYTVCGFYPDNWQTYCGYWDAISQRMAYLTAYEAELNDTGRYLYVANVHAGEQPRIAVPGTSEPPAFGDPACKTPADMADAMAALLGKV
jgi:hypothetical protein